ncbi:MAG: SH3 domain-containing protein [Hyphomicrobiaceae bacterium]
MRGSAHSRWLAAASIGCVALGLSAGTAAAICVVGIDPGDRLQMREGPGVRNRPVAAIPAGVCDVRVLGCRGRWCRVSWRGQTGWSNSNFLGWLRPPTADELARQRRLDDATDPMDVVREPPGSPAGEPDRDITAAPDPDDPPDRHPEPADPPAKTTTTVPNAARPSAQEEPVAQPPRPETAPRAADVPMPAPKPQPAARPPEKPAAATPLEIGAEHCVRGVEEGGTLKVRTGPGEKFALRYGFTANTCGVKITGACKSGWCPVDYRGYKGWAEQDKLQPKS